MKRLHNIFLVISIIFVSLTLINSMSKPLSPLKCLNFFNTVGKLKTLKRTGWVNHSKYTR